MHRFRPLFLLSSLMAATMLLPFFRGSGLSQPIDLLPVAYDEATRLATGTAPAEVNITLLLFALSFVLAALAALLAFAGYASRLLTLFTGLSPVLPFAWLWQNPGANIDPLVFLIPDGPYGDHALLWAQLQARYDIGAAIYLVLALILLVLAISGRAHGHEPVSAYEYDLNYGYRLH